MERKPSDEDQNVNRLSNLPDDVICHILSFLPTKLSLSTSILAKRWRFMWAHVPVLDFVFDHANPKRATFPGIVCAFMLRHKVASLTTFRLTYTGADVDSLGCYEHASCVATVVERNVQNLHLEGVRVEVPRCVLTCKTLVDLAMIEEVSIPTTAPIYLPSLKKLHLFNLKCEVDFTRLLSGCPVLEELIIEGTKCRDPRGCYISSPTLKRLTIYHLLDSSMFYNPDYMVTINTPALRYLHVDDFSSKHISISLCTNLVEAEIYIGYLFEFDYFHRRGLLKLLERICNVKSLILTAICNEIRGDGLMLGGSIAKFGNLTKLELRAPWYLHKKILETAHHLQVLTIFEDDLHSIGWMELAIEERCACLSLHSLRTVRIGCFMCTEQGFNIVRYILMNAQVLERLEINSSWNVDLKKKIDAIRKITLFRRESKKCELDFS